jgi:hypothetical protein
MSQKRDDRAAEARTGVTSTIWPLGFLLGISYVLWILAWKHYAGRVPLHGYSPMSLSSFAPFEAPFLLAAALMEFIAFAWVTVVFVRRPHPWLDAKWRELLERPTVAYLAYAGVAFALAISVAFGVVHLHTITEDEKTYLFQSWLLRRGSLSVPVPPGAMAFWQPFIVPIAGNWTAQYFWAQPALLALGTLVHCPWVISALELSMTVFFTGLLASEYADRRAGVLAATLAATSPMLVMTGGTLHNSNLSATCGAMSLWALVRLAKRPGLPATLALGLSTAVGLHNRMLDHAALLFSAGIVIAIHYRARLPELARRLAPAVLIAAPFLALHLIINRAQSGSYWHGGYWLFNEGHGWTTMGFGRGPFGTPHTIAIASAKTLSALVRVAFFATGCPIGLLAACLPLFGIRGKGGRGMAPLVVVAIYVIAYFFYAGVSIDTTGPVYYVALAPLLLAAIATNMVDLHDALRDVSRLRRLVPAMLIGQSVAAVIVLWPPELLQLARAADDSARCDALIEVAGVERGLVFVELGAPKPAMSWTNRAPLALPPFDAPVLFAPSQGPAEDVKTVATFAGDRPIYLAKCVHENDPALLKYDPDRNLVGPLEGADFSGVRSPPVSPLYW